MAEGNIKIRNFIIRDAYKERWMREKSLEKEKERRNKLEIQNRSFTRFSSSPFAVNALGLEEIREHNRNFGKRHSKERKPPKGQEENIRDYEIKGS